MQIGFLAEFVAKEHQSDHYIMGISRQERTDLFIGWNMQAESSNQKRVNEWSHESKVIVKADIENSLLSIVIQATNKEYWIHQATGK